MSFTLTIQADSISALRGKLSDCVIGPVIHGNIHKRIRGKRRYGERCEGDDCENYCKFLHCCVTPLVEI